MEAAVVGGGDAGGEEREAGPGDAREVVVGDAGKTFGRIGSRDTGKLSTQRYISIIQHRTDKD